MWTEFEQSVDHLIGYLRANAERRSIALKTLERNRLGRRAIQISRHCLGERFGDERNDDDQPLCSKRHLTAVGQGPAGSDASVASSTARRCLAASAVSSPSRLGPRMVPASERSGAER